MAETIADELQNVAPDQLERVKLRIMRIKSVARPAGKGYDLVRPFDATVIAQRQSSELNARSRIKPKRS